MIDIIHTHTVDMAYVAGVHRQPPARLFGGGKPIDMGKNFSDNKRILGDGKTIRASFSARFAVPSSACSRYGWRLPLRPTWRLM